MAEEIYVTLQDEKNEPIYPETRAEIVKNKAGKTLEEVTAPVPSLEIQELNVTQINKSSYNGLLEAIASVTEDKYKVRGIVVTWHDSVLDIWSSMRYNGTDVEGWNVEDNWVFVSDSRSYETISITLTADNKAEMLIGTTIQLEYGEENKSFIWNGEPIVEKIPSDIKYTISLSYVYEFVNPEPFTDIAIKGYMRAINFNFVALKVDTIVINQEELSPGVNISGDVNGEVINQIRSNFHCVLAKKTDEGKVSYCLLDDTNREKYYDKVTNSTLTQTGTDVFVKSEVDFWYKGTENINAEISFALQDMGPDWCKWDKNTMIGCYEGMVTTVNKLYSRSGITPAMNLSYEDFKSYADGRGQGYQMVDWQMHCVIGMLFVALYGTTNAQVVVGKGTNAVKNTGETNSLGMTDTIPENVDGVMSINFLGLENWWGNIQEVLDDFHVNEDGTAVTVNDIANGGTREISYDDVTKYPTRMKFGKYLDTVCAIGDKVAGSASLGYCDQQTLKMLVNGVAFRSGATNSTAGGPFYLNISKKRTALLGTNIGTRLAFRGECTRIDDINEFKSLPYNL